MAEDLQDTEEKVKRKPAVRRWQGKCGKMQKTDTTELVRHMGPRVSEYIERYSKLADVRLSHATHRIRTRLTGDVAMLFDSEDPVKRREAYRILRTSPSEDAGAIAPPSFFEKIEKICRLKHYGARNIINTALAHYPVERFNELFSQDPQLYTPAIVLLREIGCKVRNEQRKASRDAKIQPPSRERD